MAPQLLQIAALTLTALGLAPGAAHLMELPVKLGYPPELYAEVTSTLYAWFGRVGGTVQVAAAVTVAGLAFLVRREPQARTIAASAAALVVSLLLWGLLVGPVNAAWDAAAVATPEARAAVYDGLRLRWEFGHVAAFIAWLAGWLGLAEGITRSSRRPSGSAR
jgi:hypothetical protein